MAASASVEMFSSPISGPRGVTEAPPTAPRALTVADISGMRPREVDDLFHSGEVDQIPDGQAAGVALFRPGSRFQPLLERWVHAWAWQGKRFEGKPRRLKNLISPFGLAAISADVYRDRSWFDAQPCIALDYSKRSFVARMIRDEIRRIAPGLYLGLVYIGRTRVMYFTLQFPV